MDRYREGSTSQPLLYQVASGLLDPSAIASPVRTILRRVHNVDVLRAEVTGVDLEHRQVNTSVATLDYDYLVLASGSVTDYFGNDDVREQSFGLKDLRDALILRSRLLDSFERAGLSDDAATRRRLLTFAVVGAGPTGVEYSGAVAELINHVLPKDYPRIDFSEVTVLLIEAGDRILATFASRLSRLATHTLRRKGVRIVLGQSAQGVRQAVCCSATVDASKRTRSSGPPEYARRRSSTSRGMRSNAVDGSG